jgi:hypothetical protein
MRKLLLGVLLLPALALAEPVKVDKEVVCDKTADMLAYFVEKYKEMPQWLGQSDQTKSQVVIMTNAETQTWTLIQFNEQVACILETGKGIKFKLPGDPT